MADSGSGGKRPVGTGTAGCLAVSLGFALCGSVFVWSFFAAVRVRGNPYFGLVMGSVFLILGVVGTIVTLSARRR